MLISRLLERIWRLPPASGWNVDVERTVRVPMDDGIELLADLYAPRTPGPHPTILVRSPYGRAGPLGLLWGRLFAERGYRVLLQSCRGTFGSGGRFEPNFHERADGLSTIRWLEAQPWFDGRLAMNGFSYLGAVQWAVADAAGPFLRALCTHMTYSNIAEYWYRGDSFALGDMLDWTTLVHEQETRRFQLLSTVFEGRQRRIDRVINRLPIADLDQVVLGRRVEFWQQLLAHPTSHDPFWAPIDHTAQVAEVTSPVLQVAGWYDIFLPIQLADHQRLVAAGHQPRLVIGPWTHIAPQGVAEEVRQSLHFLDQHLRNESGDRSAAELPVRLFVTGAEEWRDFPAWPPPGHQAQRWHLQPGGRLHPAPPQGSPPTTYTYDPADPTPIAGGTLLRRSGGRRDQARVEARSDVLVFTSDVLTTEVEVIGEATADIHVSSDLEHFDVFVRLCDVDPQGRSTNLCDGIQRISPQHWPRPPGGVWTVSIALWPTAHRFGVGHRIRLQVASAAHPRFIRNLGTDEPLGTGTTMRIAHQAIHHDSEQASAITLPITQAH